MKQLGNCNGAQFEIHNAHDNGAAAAAPAALFFCETAILFGILSCPSMPLLIIIIIIRQNKGGLIERVLFSDFNVWFGVYRGPKN